VDVMADDRDARIAQLEAELQALRQREAALAGALAESHEQQRVTAEILRVLASSPSDVQSVLDMVVQRAMRLSDSRVAILRTLRHDDLTIAALAGEVYLSRRIPADQPLTMRTTATRAVIERRTIHIPDRSDPAVLTEFPDLASRAPLASLTVPLLRDAEAIGSLDVVRDRAEPYSEREIALVETFADQAVIAIENAHLFEALERRNRELGEALEQQTSTAEVLRVIASSPTDLQSALQSILESAAALCDAPGGLILQLDDGGRLVPRVSYGITRERSENLPDEVPDAPLYRSPTRSSVAGRALLDARTIHVHDMAEAVKGEYHSARAWQAHFGARTNVTVPLIGRDAPFGVFSMQRFEVHPFTEQQLSLLEMFADQAVIAIENARLFRGLTEALQQQTTTSDILRVIASSPTELQPALDAIAESAARVCGASHVRIVLVEGDTLRDAAAYGQLAAAWQATPPCRSGAELSPDGS
jgi:GAF domain-containing protein